MAPAADVMAKALIKIDFQNAEVPVVQNVTVQPEISAYVLRENLVSQVTGRVRWRETMSFFNQAEVTDFVELGTGRFCLVLQNVQHRMHVFTRLIRLMIFWAIWIIWEERQLMFDLSGKTALVTGASGGIGSKIVTALHGQGAKVILHGTRADRLASLQESFGERAYCLPADLSDREAVTKIMETAAELAGPVDILVNNAGITRDNLFMRMKDEDWDDVLAVNMTSSMLLCRSAIRSMMKARWGHHFHLLYCGRDW